jgi:hypothetical protein
VCAITTKNSFNHEGHENTKKIFWQQNGGIRDEKYNKIHQRNKGVQAN